MKDELNIPPELVSAIVDGVVARFRPILTGLQTKPSQGYGLIGMVESSSRGEGQQNRSHTLPEIGYIRLKEILEIIPVSKSTWYKGIAEGRYPKPTKRFGPRIAAWDIRDIRALLDNKVA